MTAVQHMVRLAASVAVAGVLTATNHAAAEPPELDLTLYGGALISSAIASANNDRLDAVGPVLGVSGFLRLGLVLGVGLVLEHHQLGWDAEGYDEGSISHDLALVAARLYFVKAGAADFFGQLGLGYGAVTYSPEHPRCSVEDGFAAQLALGAEWRIARALGLHTSVGASPFGWGMGCDEVGYVDGPQDSPWPHIGLSARVGLTTVWVSP